MLAARITCPRCGQELTVSENAPPRVSCPRCLALLINPASPESGMRPMPVIPLDRQVERDTQWAGYLVYGLLGLLGIAAVATVASGGGLRTGTYVLLLLGGIATVMYFLGAARPEKVSPGEYLPQPEGLAPPPLPSEAGGPTVLQYGVPRVSRRPGATPGAVAAGFFSAVGVCAAGFFILASTASYNPGGGSRATSASSHALILAGVVCMVIVYIISSIRITRGWRGFGIGATSGLCLGMLALGPCAACYLLTLG